MNRHSACTVLLTIVLLGATAVAAGASAQAGGGLSQLAGTAGCVSETGSGGECADGKALDRASAIAPSADGKHTYVASSGSDAVVAFSRDKSTGVLSQLAGTAGCVSEDGSGGECTDGKALAGASKVAVSADGKHVYVASPGGDAVAIFARDKKSGALSQLAGIAGCLSETGNGGECTDGKAVDGVAGVAVSADGKDVYVASSGSNAVAVFARDKNSSALTQLAGTAGCVSETGSGGECTDGKALDGASDVAVSADGMYVYVASYFSDAVAVFARDKNSGALTQLAGTAGCMSETGSGGECTDGKALDGPEAIATSADGRHVYVASFDVDAVAVFARDKKSGALTQLAGIAGCVSETGSGGECTDGKALDGAFSVAVSADGKSVYAVADTSDAVAVFARDKKAGALTQLAGSAGCVSETGGGGECIDGKALDGASDVAVSVDGKHVYAASYDGDAVAVFARG
jgi:6-phosphogluconolactonase (cycloisomerase 2 family)